MSPVVLMVCEKPSIAESITRALSHGNFGSRHVGRLNVLEFDAPFQSYGRCQYRVVGLFGHIFSTDFPAKYNNWQSVSPIDLFDAPVLKLPEKGKDVTGALEGVARGTDFVVLCLDCDREGENICFEVLSIIKSKLNKRSEQQIFRARFSAVTASDMHHAMAHLTVPNQNESMAVDVRQELDLKVGVAFTRYQTTYFQNKYGNLQSELISYGPCQVWFSLFGSNYFSPDHFSPFQTFSIRLQHSGSASPAMISFKSSSPRSTTFLFLHLPSFLPLLLLPPWLQLLVLVLEKGLRQKKTTFWMFLSNGKEAESLTKT